MLLKYKNLALCVSTIHLFIVFSNNNILSATTFHLAKIIHSPSNFQQKSAESCFEISQSSVSLFFEKMSHELERSLLHYTLKI
jgi:hypothetical protein